MNEFVRLPSLWTFGKRGHRRQETEPEIFPVHAIYHYSLDNLVLFSVVGWDGNVKRICQVRCELNEGSAMKMILLLGYDPILDKKDIQIRF